MNETQKCAWFGLIGSILMLGFGISMTIVMLSSGGQLCTMMRIWRLPMLLFVTAFIVFAFRAVIQKAKAKKQGTAKVDYDERDKLIEKRAMLAFLYFLLIALAGASVIPQLIVGRTGAIPAWLLPIINFGVVLVASIGFAVAILIQYGWRGRDRGGKDEQS